VWTRKDGHVRTPHGSVVVRVPKLYRRKQKDPLKLAEMVFSTLLHELWHYMEKVLYPNLPVARADESGRRPPHDSRPEERRAYAAEARLMASLPPQAQEAVLELAVWIEETNKLYSS